MKKKTLYGSRKSRITESIIKNNCGKDLYGNKWTADNKRSICSKLLCCRPQLKVQAEKQQNIAAIRKVIEH